MSPDDERFADLEERLVAAEKQLAQLRRIEVAPESGGGQGVYGEDNVVIVLNGLTPTPT